MSAAKIAYEPSEPIRELDSWAATLRSIASQSLQRCADFPRDRPAI